MTPDDLSKRLWQFAARVGKVVAELLSARRISSLSNESNALRKIIAKSIITAKTNRRRPPFG